jgi:hypothetical protein
MGSSLRKSSSAEEVKVEVESLGSAFKVYAEAIVENGIDGDMLCDLTEKDLVELGVTSALHQKKLLKAIAAFVAAVGGRASARADTVAPKPEFSLLVEFVKVPASTLISPIHGLKQIAIMPLLKACASIEDIVDGVQNKAQASLCFTNPINPPGGNTSHDESGSITLYTEEWTPAENSLYYILNRVLRDSDRTKLIPFFPYLKLLLTALLHQPRYKGSVWRGVKADLRTQYPKGSKVIWWSFSSCTTEMSALESDLFLGKSGTRTLFRIDNCTRAVDIQKFSGFPMEAEVLLIPGVHLEVVDVGDMGNGLVIITLKQIPPPFDPIDFDWDEQGDGGILISSSSSSSSSNHRHSSNRWSKTRVRRTGFDTP